MKRGLILVEGPTEERFVKDVLSPHLLKQQFALTPTIIPTKRVFDGVSFKGGISHFDQIEKAMRLLLRGAGGALLTTMIDFYRLPQDVPGMKTRPAGSPEQRVVHVEKTLAAHFGNPGNLHIHLSLHEFEALLFTGPRELASVVEDTRGIRQIEAIQREFPNPEHINERPELAPSCRLESIFPRYRKRLHGPNTAARIGIERLRGGCPHFAAWLNQLEIFAAS
ncbi:MAG: DUF4276 family protein [Opitutaceae bacterium]